MQLPVNIYFHAMLGKAIKYLPDVWKYNRIVKLPAVNCYLHWSLVIGHLLRVIGHWGLFMGYNRHLSI